jgi:uncharacterized membrane protein YjfL (UPF0719 family)
MFTQAVWTNLALMLVYFLLGLVYLVLGKLFWRMITPYDDIAEIRDKKNRAVGITQAGVFVAIAILIHASLAGKSLFEGEALGTKLLYDALLSTIYFVIGLVVLWFGGKVMNIVIRHEILDAIEKEQNEASAWVVSGFYVGVSVIIHAAA